MATLKKEFKFGDIVTFEGETLKDNLKDKEFKFIQTDGEDYILYDTNEMDIITVEISQIVSNIRKVLPFDFESFKTMLSVFIKEHYSPCKDFYNSLGDCDDADDIKRVFRMNNDDVFEKLGGSIDDNSDEIDELERDVSRLENKNSDLEDEVSEAKCEFGTSLDDDFKREIILKYIKKYTSWELEALFEKDNK